MSDSIKLSSVALDCPNAKLAAFYADITGGKVPFLHKDAEIQVADGLNLVAPAPEE